MSHKFAIHTYTVQIIVEGDNTFEPELPGEAIMGEASGSILSESVEWTDDIKKVGELTKAHGSDPEFFGLHFDEESGQWSEGVDIED